MTSPGVFISYSHKDDPQWIDRVRTHLEPLKRNGLELRIWDDRRIEAGMPWQQEISNALNSTRVALLFISANFFASEYIWEKELPSLLLAAENEGTVVLPLIVSASRFLRTPELAKYQAVNDPCRPLTALRYGEQEEVFDQTAKRIESLLIVPMRSFADSDTPAYQSSSPIHSTALVSGDVARAAILEHAARIGASVGPVVAAPISI